MTTPAGERPCCRARIVTTNPVESKGSNPHESAMDLRKFLGLSYDARKGYATTRFRFTVEADASAEALREPCGCSPVFAR